MIIITTGLKACCAHDNLCNNYLHYLHACTIIIRSVHVRPSIIKQGVIQDFGSRGGGGE